MAASVPCPSEALRRILEQLRLVGAELGLEFELQIVCIATSSAVAPAEGFIVAGGVLGDEFQRAFVGSAVFAFAVGIVLFGLGKHFKLGACEVSL